MKITKQELLEIESMIVFMVPLISTEKIAFIPMVVVFMSLFAYILILITRYP
jgi:hypothetical protein